MLHNMGTIHFNRYFCVLNIVFENSVFLGVKSKSLEMLHGHVVARMFNLMLSAFSVCVLFQKFRSRRL